jgi:Golgi nucleoside diphosphatase
MKVQVKDLSAAFTVDSVEFYETKSGEEVTRLVFDECLHQNVSEEFNNLYCDECNVLVQFDYKGEDDFDCSDDLREREDERGY